MRNKTVFVAALTICGCSLAWAQSTVVGAPKSFSAQTPAVAAAGKETLKYRDPQEPLPLGEVAEAQRIEAAEDFLNKLGYTTIKPTADAKAHAGGQGQAELPIELPPAYLKVVAVYGKAAAPQADIDHDGNTISAAAGARVGPYLISSISSRGVTLQRRPACTQSRKKVKSTACAPVERVLAVGEVVEWKR